jgi:hypothetical protein
MDGLGIATMMSRAGTLEALAFLAAVVDLAALQCRTCIEHRLRRRHEPGTDVAAVARGMHEYLFLQFFLIYLYGDPARGTNWTQSPFFASPSGCLFALGT